jgi:predicted RNA-binding Zn-ribbon protein involved in translation (DUF1610 family)
MSYITIKESHYQTELVVLKSRLESEGIECRFKNELTTQVLNYIPSFLVELQVPEEDVQRANEIMNEAGNPQVENAKLICPNCGSEKVKLKVSVVKWIQLFFSVLLALDTNVPMDKLFKKSKFYCKDCREEFIT